VRLRRVGLCHDFLTYGWCVSHKAKFWIRSVAQQWELKLALWWLLLLFGVRAEQIGALMNLASRHCLHSVIASVLFSLLHWLGVLRRHHFSGSLWLWSCLGHLLSWSGAILSLIGRKEVSECWAQFRSWLFDFLSRLFWVLNGLVGQGKCWRHRLDRHHLDQDFLRILQSLVQRLVCDLKVYIILCTQWHLLHFLLWVDKSDDSTARTQNKLRLVLEHDLDHFICVSQKDSFFGTFPLFDVN